MDIDSFLDGGFEALAAEAKPASEKLKRSKSQKPGVSPAPESVSAKGKAKRPQQAGDAKQNAQSASGQDPAEQEIESHKAQLEALKTADPEFYKYLLESDKALLDFSDDEDAGAAASGGSASDNEAPADSPRAGADDSAGHDGAAASTTGRLDSALVEKWCHGAEKDASLGAVRNVVRAFRAACHYGDPQEAGDDGNLRIMSDAAFQKVLVFTLTEADTFFRRLLGVAASGALSESVFSTGRWRKVQPLLKSYLGNALHLLAHLAEESTSTFILRRLRTSIAFLPRFPALQAKFTKLVLSFFGASPSRRVRVQSLLWLRELALSGGRKALDGVLKGAYRTFAAHAAFVSKASIADIAFMGTGLVELYGLQPAASYEHVFGFVAQLAVLLRNALTIKSVDAYRQVYCWKAINCLELWARVLASHAPSTELQPLVYPVIQLLMGAARLVPSARWFPVRLRIARVLIALCSATGAYVPIAPLLLELLSWPDFGKSARGTGTCPDLLLQLKLSKSNLKQPAVQQELIEQAMELLASSLALSARSPAFPELVHLPVLALKRFAKASPVDKFRSQARLLLDALDTNARFVGVRRDAAEFAPKDTDAVAAFLQDQDAKSIPLIAYAQRLTARGAERRQAAAANAVDLQASGVAMDSDEENSDEEAVQAADLLPRPKPASKAAAKQPRAAKVATATAPETVVGDGDAADTVEAFVLSEDEDGIDDDGDATMAIDADVLEFGDEGESSGHRQDGAAVSRGRGRARGPDRSRKGRDASQGRRQGRTDSRGGKKRPRGGGQGPQRDKKRKA